ncbi:MAG: tRNA lysidine(34) synthetase TilS, partial [Dehalococcoidia bacterium]
MSTSSLAKRVEGTLRTAELLQPSGCDIVVAVSGGPDSLTLLGLLRTLAQEHPLRLHVAHLNHGLRGSESDEDARYVHETCHRLDVPFTIEEADVAEFRARHRLSWEAAAREVRYGFLSRVAATVGASAVVLGHTADDQAETVLLHLLRGTGIRGLRGMLPLSRWRSRDGTRDVALVRPMLGVTSQETEGYCSSLGLTPRNDSSNLMDRFTRNRIRRRLIPRLQQYNPAVREALARLARTVAQDVAYIDQQVQEVWPSVVAPEPWGVRLRRDTFNGLHPSLQAHLLQRAYAELAGEDSQLNLAQVEGMRRLALKGAGRSLSLGQRLRFFTSYGEMLIARDPPGSPWPPLEERGLSVDGELCTQGWNIRLRLVPAAGFTQDRTSHDAFRAFLTRAAVGDGLSVRTRRPGDRFQPLGMEGTKKLKEFMIDARIPRAWRDGVPLVVGKRGIAWVVGWRIAHWAR